jgi:hypothetical protein
MVIPDAPQNLVGDNALYFDKLDSELRRYGIELIAPHRMNRKNTTQDLRRLRRYRRRWKIERLNGCLRGYKISASWLFVANATLRTFLEFST